MIKGVDLAYCNINVDYSLMKADGVRFAIIKLGQGLLPKDAMFDTHRIGCEYMNIPWNPYWFCDYRYSGSLNIDQLISKAGGNYGRRRVCQDLEFRKVWGYPPGSRMLSFCLDFFSELESRTGIVGTLYTNRDLLNQMWVAARDCDKEELARHDLWFATDIPNPKPTHLPIKINQWDLDSKVYWSQGAVDLNDFWGTEEEFESWVIGSPPPMTIEQRVTLLEEWVERHG